MRKYAKRLHLWLALPFGVILTLVCFSGAVLAFEKEFTQWAYAGLYQVETVGKDRLPVGDIAAKVASSLPDDVRVTGITIYSDPARTYQVNLSKPHHASVFVDPYTGEVKGSYRRIPFFLTMFKLHRWLLGSRPADGGVFWGRVVVGTSALAFVFVILSGIVMWLPRSKKALVNSLKVNCSHGLRRFCHSFHVAVGAYTCLLLLCMALTGLTWSFDWYRSGFMLCSGLADSKKVTDIHLRKNGIEDTTATTEQRHMPSGRQYTGNWRHVILNTGKSQSMPTIQQRYCSVGSATPWAATVMSSTRPQAD